jgi:hypothetical protein
VGKHSHIPSRVCWASLPVSLSFFRSWLSVCLRGCGMLKLVDFTESEEVLLASTACSPSLSSPRPCFGVSRCNDPLMTSIYPAECCFFTVPRAGVVLRTVLHVAAPAESSPISWVAVLLSSLLQGCALACIPSSASASHQRYRISLPVTTGLGPTEAA